MECEAGRIALPVLHVNRDRLIIRDLAREDEARERIANLLLHEPLERTRTVGRIEAALGKPILGGFAHVERDAAVLETRRERSDLETNDMAQLLATERVEQHDVVKTVEKLGLERRTHGVHDRAPFRAVVEARILEEVCAEVRGQDQDGVPEIHRAALAVGEAAVVEHLEENVEDIRVGLFNLVQEHDGVRAASDLLGQLPTFFVADVARGRPYEARNAVLLAVGPRKRNEPVGRFGSEIPARERRTASATSVTARC